ncbi:uncharacterized protein BT62DRAFT_887077, partial [Guyanagaster necrorhizus]
QKSRAIKCGGRSFDTDELGTKLITFMGGRRFVCDSGSEKEDSDVTRALDWQRIGRRVWRRAAEYLLQGFMLRPLSIEVKKRLVRRARLEKNKDLRRPQEDIIGSDNETAKDVILRIGRINLFHLVINPEDFALSVENIFHLSFLIREGKAGLEFENGEPMMYPCSEEHAPGSDEDAPRRSSQLIMEFDHATWKVRWSMLGVGSTADLSNTSHTSVGWNVK